MAATAGYQWASAFSTAFRREYDKLRANIPEPTWRSLNLPEATEFGDCREIFCAGRAVYSGGHSRQVSPIEASTSQISATASSSGDYGAVQHCHRNHVITRSKRQDSKLQSDRCEQLSMHVEKTTISMIYMFALLRKYANRRVSFAFVHFHCKSWGSFRAYDGRNLWRTRVSQALQRIPSASTRLRCKRAVISRRPSPRVDRDSQVGFTRRVSRQGRQY